MSLDDSSESTPLLSSSAATTNNPSRSDNEYTDSSDTISVTSSVKDDDEVSVRVLRASSVKSQPSLVVIIKKFSLYLIVSVLFSAAFRLVFLPRTSLSRDLKRLHNDKIVKSDLKRIYLSSFEKSLQDDIKRRYNRIVGGGVSGDNDKLVQYLVSELRSANYPRAHILQDSYRVRLANAVESSLVLKNDGEIVYETAGKDDVVASKDSLNVKIQTYRAKGRFCYAGQGSSSDFNFLQTQGVDVSGAVVIMRAVEDSIDEQLHNVMTAGGVGAIFIGDSTTIVTSSRTHVNIPFMFMSQDKMIPVLCQLSGFSTIASDTPSGISNSSLTIDLSMVEKSTEKTITNVILKIPGIYSNNKVVVGANMNSLTFSNSHSSVNMLLEICLRFQKLLKIGWRPLRDINIVFWDGNSLDSKVAGSSQHVMKYKSQLLGKVIAYIDIEDIAGSHLRIESDQLMVPTIQKTAQHVDVGESTLYDSWEDRDILLISDNSDAYSFQKLGVPSVHMAFEDGADNGILSYEQDRDDKIHEILCKFLGLYVLSFDEKEVIGYNFEGLSSMMKRNHKPLGSSLAKWSNRYIDSNLIESLFPNERGIARYFTSLMNSNSKLSGGMTLGQLIDIITAQLVDFKHFSEETDKVLSELQEEIIEDFPWFSLHRKIGYFFQLKRTNKRLNLINKNLVRDSEYFLTGAASRESVNRKTGIFMPNLQREIQNNNYENTVKWTLILSQAIDELSQF